MAIAITNSQGTRAYLVDVGTTLTTIMNVETAVATAETIDCIQDIGDISASRSVQEYSCLSSDEIAKSLGSITLPSVDMSLIFDADNAGGQAEIRAMFTGNARKILVIELADGIRATDATKNLTNLVIGNIYPTVIYFEVAVSKFGNMISKDNAVMQSATFEICSKPIYIYQSATVKA